MKSIYLIRHAKSDWSNPFIKDFNRPLNKRGKRSAPLMGEVLKSKEIEADLILSSPAKRAKKTAIAIAKKTNYKKEIVFIDNIYEASCNTLENIIKSIEKKYNIVFLVGHNPGLNMISSKFVNFFENIPTCGIVGISFCTQSWQEINKKKANYLSFEYPKKYQNK